MIAPGPSGRRLDFRLQQLAATVDQRARQGVGYVNFGSLGAELRSSDGKGKAARRAASGRVPVRRRPGWIRPRKWNYKSLQ